MKTNKSNIFKSVAAATLISLTLAAGLTVSTGALAAPFNNSPHYNHGQYNNPFVGIDNAIRNQDREIRNGTRSGALTAREQQIVQTNANHLKSLRNRASWDARLNRHEIIELTSLVKQNQYTLNGLLNNRETVRMSRYNQRPHGPYPYNR